MQATTCRLRFRSPGTATYCTALTDSCWSSPSRSSTMRTTTCHLLSLRSLSSIPLTLQCHPHPHQLAPFCQSERALQRQNRSSTWAMWSGRDAIRAVQILMLQLFAIPLIAAHHISTLRASKWCSVELLSMPFGSIGLNSFSRYCKVIQQHLL